MSFTSEIYCKTPIHDKYNDNLIFPLGGIEKNFFKFYTEIDSFFNCYIYDIYPILYPLSYLTKEIVHKGERIHILTFLCEKYRNLYPNELLAAIQFGTVDFNIMMDLISFHFDVADLISKGEAIDVNSLKINPYK